MERLTPPGAGVYSRPGTGPAGHTNEEGSTVNAKTTTRGGLDWSAKHNVITGTVNATGGLLATSMVGSLAEVSPVWALAAGGCGAIAHTIAVAAKSGRAGIAARAGGWLASGGWLSYTLATSPWSWSSLASLACLGVAGGVTASVLSAADNRKAVTRTTLVMATQRARKANDWESRLHRVCGIRGAEIAGVEHWPEGTGYTLDVNLPPGGESWRDLASAAIRLAADANLPEGCGIEVGPGATRRAALIRVSTVNALAEEVAYPNEITPLSINNPIPMGLHRDASIGGLLLRQDTGIMVGQKGGGKTNQLQVINAGLVRCTDTLVWHIDLNGGGMSLPWIYPWHENRVAVPAIDWVATTASEAERMTEAALRIAKGRKVAYRALRRAAGDDKLPVSPKVPQIMIVVDECAEVMAENTPHKRVRNNLEEIQRIARAEGVNLVFCGLRATTDVIGSTAVLKQARARVAMRVSDPEELNYLFGWTCKATPEDIPYAGCGLYLQDTSGTPRPFKGYRLVGAALEEIAVAVAGLRPALDAPSAELAGRDYASRWDRAGHLFTDEAPIPDLDEPEDTEGGSALSLQEQLNAAASVFVQPELSGPRADDEIDWSDPAQWPPITVPGTAIDVTGIPELLRRLLDAMHSAGVERQHSQVLAEAIGTSPETLGSLLPQIGIKALPNPFNVDGVRARGYARADLETVAERIRSGETAVPGEVANWRPE